MTPSPVLPTRDVFQTIHCGVLVDASDLFYLSGWGRGRGSRAAKRGCFKRGGFPIWTCPSFFVLYGPFWDFPDFAGIFPICSGMVRGFSRFVLFLFLGLLRAPTRNSPARVRDTIWTFPEKSGKHPGLETPRFSFSQEGGGVRAGGRGGCFFLLKSREGGIRGGGGGGTGAAPQQKVFVVGHYRRPQKHYIHKNIANFFHQDTTTIA